MSRPDPQREPTDEVLAAVLRAAVAVGRAHMATTEPAKHAAKRWLVVRQFNHLPDAEVCQHRWEWTADMCAYRRTRRHPNEVGAHYTVRRAEATPC